MKQIALIISILMFLVGCNSDGLLGNDNMDGDTSDSDPVDDDFSDSVDLENDHVDGDQIDGDVNDTDPIDSDVADAESADGDLYEENDETDVEENGENLPPVCMPGTTVCSDDGYGFIPCGENDQGVPYLGDRIPCDPNRSCNDGVCSVGDCEKSLLMYLLDRSSSMLAGDTWAWVKETFISSVDERDHVNFVGFRQFPASNCNIGVTLPLSMDNAENISAAITDPDVGSSTPIAASLRGLINYFGDPSQRQAVILMTDGEETCEEKADAITEAEKLFMAGVFVHVIAITTAADRSFLDELAQVGGTGQSRLVTNAEEFEQALLTIYTSIGSRRCDPDNTCCDQDGCSLADSSSVCGGECMCSEEQGECIIDNYISYACYDDDVYWYDCRGEVSQKKEECGDCVCNGDECVIAPHYSFQCSSNDVYWYDCKGTRQEKKEECGAPGCRNDVCCTTHHSFSCLNGDVYWFNSCGIREDLKETCDECACNGNACIMDTQYSSQCYDNDVYWYDCHGLLQEKRQECGLGNCNDGLCVGRVDPIIFEAEDIVDDTNTIPANQVSVVDNANASGGQMVCFNGSMPQVHRFVLMANLENPGTYVIKGVFVYGSDMGTYQTLVSGQPVSAPLDFYAESSALSDEILIGTRDISTAGDIMVLFVQQTPNASATASRICVDTLIFE